MPDNDKLSYAIGFNIGSTVKKDHIDVNAETLAAAIKDVMAGRPARMNEQEVKAIITQLQQALPGHIAAYNKTNGEAYLVANAKAPGVKTLTNGLQYKVLKEGFGPMPKAADTVNVSYKGRLIDGTVFDQKDSFNTPVTGRTIKGWSEILPLMKTGSKWEVTIPSDLAYGASGFGARGPQRIGPNATLIFELELLSIAPPPAPASVATPASVSITQSAGTAPRTSPPAPPTMTTPVVSGQIIKVPSAEELKKGAKIEVITNTATNSP
jgi:FKBP-type peptidyl-prolyl cis-trans isomerase FklB